MDYGTATGTCLGSNAVPAGEGADARNGVENTMERLESTINQIAEKLRPVCRQIDAPERPPEECQDSPTEMIAWTREIHRRINDCTYQLEHIRGSIEI
jgi:hypothetical protein